MNSARPAADAVRPYRPHAIKATPVQRNLRTNAAPPGVASHRPHANKPTQALRNVRLIAAPPGVVSTAANAALAAAAARAHRPHASKPTPTQRNLLAIFFEEHPALARGRLPGENAASRAGHMWRTLTQRLNASGGCVKTWKQWRKFWADKKTYLRHLAAQRRRLALGAGGDPALVAPLEEWDKRMLKLMGDGSGPGDIEVSVDLFPDVQVKRQPDADHVEVVAIDEENAVGQYKEVQLKQEWDRIEDAGTPSPVAEPAVVEVSADPLVTPPSPPAARRRRAPNAPRPRRAPSQPALAGLQEMIREYEGARAEDRRLDRELRRQQLELQQQQIEVNRQLAGAVRMLVDLLQETRQQQ